MLRIALIASLGLSGCSILFDVEPQVAGSDGGASNDAALPGPDASQCGGPGECDEGFECLDNLCACPDGTEIGGNGNCVVSIIGDVASREDSLHWSDGTRPASCLGYLEGSPGHLASATAGFYDISIAGKVASVYCDMNSANNFAWTGFDPTSVASLFAGIGQNGVSGSGSCDLANLSTGNVTTNLRLCSFDFDVFPFDEMKIDSDIGAVELSNTGAFGTDVDISALADSSSGVWDDAFGRSHCIDGTVVGRAGGVFIGPASAVSGKEVMDLGRKKLAQQCNGNGGSSLLHIENVTTWGSDNPPSATSDSVVRIRLGVNDTEAVGLQWTAGFIFVR